MRPPWRRSRSMLKRLAASSKSNLYHSVQSDTQPPNPAFERTRQKPRAARLRRYNSYTRMRYQGRVSEWKDDRGFGFIAPNGGGASVFLHISSFSERDRRPAVGNLVTFELTTDERGRPQAKAAQFVGQPRRGHRRGIDFFIAPLVATLVFCFIADVAYVRVSHPNSTVSASIYKIFLAREALGKNNQLQCEPGKSSCSRMTSCTEAFFHQERCGVANMDGDRDGIPCEQQWCN